MFLLTYFASLKNNCKTTISCLPTAETKRRYRGDPVHPAALLYWNLYSELTNFSSICPQASLVLGTVTILAFFIPSLEKRYWFEGCCTWGCRIVWMKCLVKSWSATALCSKTDPERKCKLYAETPDLCMTKRIIICSTAK